MSIILNILFFLSLILYINNKYKKNKNLSKSIMLALVFYHLFFNLIYFLVFGNQTDAYVQYYMDGLEKANLSTIATSTEFMYQVCYFLHTYLLYSYNDMQVLFGILTSFGFVKFYELLKEYDYKVPVKLMGTNIIYFFLFMPGFHFWLSTVQKDCFLFLGSIYFLAVMTSIEKKKFSIKSIILAVLAFILIGLPRPYMLAFIAIPTVLVFIIFNGKTKLIYKILLFAVLAFAFQFALPQLFGIESFRDLNVESVENTFKMAQSMSTFESSQGTGAGLALSGNESIIFKIFSYFYFPLFFNSPNALGYFLSFENFILIIMTFILIRHLLKKLRLLAKNKVIFLSLLCFITIIIGMSFVSYNIGSNARTKVMAYPYFFLALFGLVQLQLKPKQ